MQYTVRIDTALGVVRVIVDGACTRTGAAHMMSAARSAARETGLPLLYDLRGASPGELAKGDIFWLARTVPSPRNGVRVATLFPAAHSGTAHFWENSFRNAGLEARAFEAENEALAWLTTREPGAP